ncbi:hypothetical protein D3C85_1240280 [compost metagenome]
MLGFEHHLPGIASRYGRRRLINPLALLLAVNAAAGNEQQSIGHLPIVSQPLQHMPQTLDISGAIAGFIVIGGSRAIDQVIHRTDRPGLRAVFIEQVAGNADHALGQA